MTLTSQAGFDGIYDGVTNKVTDDLVWRRGNDNKDNKIQEWVEVEELKEIP